MNTQATAEARLLPLDQRRRIGFTIAGASVTFEFGLISPKTWRKYMESIISRIERVDGQQYEVGDEQAALVELYDGSAGRALDKDGNELKRVPLRYRVAAASILRGVSSTTVEEANLSEYTEVQLEAAWSLSSEGGMTMYAGLVHRFRQPSIDQYRRFRLGCARVLVTGDARNGTSSFPSRLAVALGLYDELIAEVEGYSWNGVDLASMDIAEAAERMDAMHKARAVLELFEHGDDDISVGQLKASGGDDESEGE